MNAMVPRCFGRCDLSGLGELSFRLPIDQIKFESAYGPTIVIDKPLEGPSAIAPFLAKLRPRLTLRVRGFAPIVMAPYGNPPPTIWPKITVAVGVVGGLVLLASGVGVYRLLRGRR